MIRKVTLGLLLIIAVRGFAQDDLLALVKEESKEPAKKVYATFKTTKIVSAQTVETVKRKILILE